MGYQTPDNINAASMVGYEQFQKERDGIRAAVFFREPIGGSRLFAVEGTGWQDAHDAIPFSLPDSVSAGAVYRVDVWRRTANTSTTIQARIRNITDNTTEDTGAAEDATTFTLDTLTFTPVAGKEYRLQFLKSDDLNPAYGFGILQRSDS